MSGTDPGDPLVLLPGGVMGAFIGSIRQLAPADPVIIGGRVTKRASDLYDVIRLVTAGQIEVLLLAARGE